MLDQCFPVYIHKPQQKSMEQNIQCRYEQYNILYIYTIQPRYLFEQQIQIVCIYDEFVTPAGTLSSQCLLYREWSKNESYKLMQSSRKPYPNLSCVPDQIIYNSPRDLGLTMLRLERRQTPQQPMNISMSLMIFPMAIIQIIK